MKTTQLKHVLDTVVVQFRLCLLTRKQKQKTKMEERQNKKVVKQLLGYRSYFTMSCNAILLVHVMH